MLPVQCLLKYKRFVLIFAKVYLMVKYNLGNTNFVLLDLRDFLKQFLYLQLLSDVSYNDKCLFLWWGIFFWYYYWVLGLLILLWFPLKWHLALAV